MVDTSITWTDVGNIAPELATLPSNQTDAILAMVNRRMNSDVWGDELNDGATFLAAHLATLLLRRKGVAGPVTGETVGQVSHTMGMLQNWTSYDTTSYGQAYQELLLTIPAARFTISC